MRIVVTGSNGLLGQNICRLLMSKFEHVCIGFSQSYNHIPELVTFECLDVSDYSALSYCIEYHKPDVIIHTAALSKPDVCEQNPELCWRVNVQATQHIVDLCKKHDIYLLHLSTDFIFDGLSPFYTEESVAQPLSVYARSKAECEHIIQAELEHYAIVRTSLVYGTVPDSSRSNLVLWVISSLRQQKAIRVCDDQFRTPTWVGDLAAACVRLSELRLDGIFNVSGPELYSVYEIALHTARCFGLSEQFIQPVSTAELREPARRPLKTHLRIEKARQAFQYAPISLHDGLTLLKNVAPALTTQ